jgi:hypothetical protein
MGCSGGHTYSRVWEHSFGGYMFLTKPTKKALDYYVSANISVVLVCGKVLSAKITQEGERYKVWDEIFTADDVRQIELVKGYSNWPRIILKKNHIEQ